MTEKAKGIPPIVALDDDEPSKRTLEYFEERVKLSQLMLEYKKAANETKTDMARTFISQWRMAH